MARERTGDAVNLVMADRADDPRWRVRVQSLDADPGTPDSRSIVTDHLNRIRASGDAHEILAFEPASWGGTKGDLLVVEQRGRDGAPVVNGWLVVGRGGLLHTVFTLSTTREHVLAARAALESSLSTLELQDIDALLRARRQRLAAGEKFVESITEEKLRSLLSIDQWFRLYRPEQGTAGAKELARELGYVHFRVVEALRGELDPQRSREELRGDEAEPGLMLVAKARGLLRDDGSEVMDIEARYWMAWDRATEAWSSRTTERKGRASRSYAQTGVRPRVRPSLPSTLTVVTVRSDLGRDPSNPTRSWDVPSRGYLNVAEALLLGWLLPRTEDAIGDFAFYAYDTKEGRLPLRLDEWSRTEDGHWLLASRPGPDEPITRQIFDGKGSRLRLIDGDGVLSDRTEPEELLRLWKSKGLPTGGQR